jgi:hypothetical protein
MSKEFDALPEEIRALHDKQQITEALYTYCRAVDRVDRELGYSIWHDDATVDYGDGIYRGNARGVIDYICESHLKGVVHSHQITNILIKLDGDRAFSEAYVISGARIIFDGVLKQITTRGRYLDRWSRRAGRWGIEKRFFAHDFGDIRTIAPNSIPARFSLDRNDPSYALFAGIL